jgi:transposase-like protein
MLSTENLNDFNDIRPFLDPSKIGLNKTGLLVGGVPRKLILQHSIFLDEVAARKALEILRWPEGCRCIKCNSFAVEEVGGIKRSHRDGLLRCKSCRLQFTVTVGTVFHRSKVPLNKWMLVIFLEDTPGVADNSWQMAQATGLTHKTVEKMRARIYSAVGHYEGPNNIFGRRVGSYVRDQRPQSYQKPPKPIVREAEDATYSYAYVYDGPKLVVDYRRWYAWRRRNPLGQRIEARGVLKSFGGAAREDLVRIERLLLQLLATQPVKMLKKRRQKKAAPSHKRWLPKKPKSRPGRAAARVV